jgi:hypothetical protein
MAGYDVNQLAQALVQKGGYNQTDATNAANNAGGRADSLAREFLGYNPQSNSSSGGNLSAGFGNSGDLVQTAQQLNQAQIASNQPAIQTLGSQVNASDPNSLQQRYKGILDSITAGSQAQTNMVTSAASSRLGARGLMPNSPEGQTEIANSLLPVQAQQQGLYSQTGLSEQQDINSVQNAIAGLQSGNFQGNVGNALGLLGANIQGQQVANTGSLALAQLAFNKQQAAIDNALRQQGLNISGGQLGVAQGQLGLAGSTFNAQYNPAVFGSYLQSIGIGAPQSSGGQTAWSVIGR